MQRKFIDITGQNKVNGKSIQWVKSIPAHNFTFITVDGVTMATIERNYYLDSKTNKIRYQTGSCENATYNHLYVVYGEVYPGIFARLGVTTEDSVSEMLTGKAAAIKRLTEQATDRFRSSLVRYGA